MILFLRRYIVEIRFELYLNINATLYNLNLCPLARGIKTVTNFFV